MNTIFGDLGKVSDGKLNGQIMDVLKIFKKAYSCLSMMQKNDKRTNNDLQKHANKTKDRVTWTPLKTGGKPKCFERMSSSCSISGTRRGNLVTNPVISHEWGMDREVFMTSGTYPWSFMTPIFHNGQPSHGGDVQLSKWWLYLNQEESLVQ